MELSQYGKDGFYNDSNEASDARKRYDGMMDRIDMERMGKKQQLKRNFRSLSIVSFMFLMMGSWLFAICGTTGGLVAAGTGGLIVVYIGCAVWYSALVASIAEMASMAPTAGGQYHWSSEFAHPKAQKFISYLAGWLLTTSWLVGIASGLFLAGQLAQACIAIANPGFVPAAWQVWLFVLMFAIAAGLANTVLAQYLALLEIMAAGLYAIAFAANLIVLWVMAPKNTSSEVFGSFVNGAGWNNNGFGILTAQLSVLFLLIGSDGAAHMSEEIQDASLSVPRGIWGSYLLGAVTGFVMLVTFCFTFTENAANTTIGFPFIQVYLDATGSVGGAQALTAVLILLIFFGAANFMASASRQTFAFARDGGLPFSRQISKVNDRFGVPLVAVGVACTVPVLLSLIDLGSTVAFEAIVSLQFIALFFTYLVSIGTLIYRRLYGPPLPERRWSLGRLGLTINIIALLYGLFALAFVVIPSVPSPTLEEMNWAPVIFVGILAFALIYYFAGGHRTYDGPVKLVKDESNWNQRE